MPVDHTTCDRKRNLVVVTLFESYLARFVLENSVYYVAIYRKVLDALEGFLQDSPEPNETLALFLSAKHFDSVARYVFSVFSRVNLFYPGVNSFEVLRAEFSLPAADYCIKIICEELFYPLIAQPSQSLVSGEDGHSSSFFSASRRSPSASFRPSMLFKSENRGVVSIVDDGATMDDEDILETRDLGIVDCEYTPPEFKDYFPRAVSAARFLYRPDENSFVARWCRQRHIPVISGASGSIEILFSRLFIRVELTAEEQKTLIFAQACNMVANGHHSFFEAMLVSHHFKCHRLEDTDTLLAFYLQCVPEIIRRDANFQVFLRSELMVSLLRDIPLFARSTPSPEACAWVRA